LGEGGKEENKQNMPFRKLERKKPKGSELGGTGTGTIKRGVVTFGFKKELNDERG